MSCSGGASNVVRVIRPGSRPRWLEPASLEARVACRTMRLPVDSPRWSPDPLCTPAPQALTPPDALFPPLATIASVSWTAGSGNLVAPPIPTPEPRPTGVRTPQDGPGVPCCGACGRPIVAPREGQRACSARCRATLHRQAQAEARAARDRELRRLLVELQVNAEAALRVLDGGRSS